MEPEGESCGNVIFPNKYKASTPKMAIQMAKNASFFRKCNCKTRSALDKNLNAKASSKNPKTTLTVLSHPPDFGMLLSQLGNMAKSINGKANAMEKPNIPITGANPSFDAASTNSVPTIGPVHEKETIANANAINRIPSIPPLSACLSTLFAHELGNIISNAPKKDVAKTISKTKKIILN